MRRGVPIRLASKPSLSIWCSATVSKLQQLATKSCEKPVENLEKAVESSASRERSFDRSRSRSASSHTHAASTARIFVVVRLPDLMADAAAHAHGAATTAVCVAHTNHAVPARCRVFSANVAAAELGVVAGQHSVEEVRMRHGSNVRIVPYAFDESERLARSMIAAVCVHAQRAVVTAFNEIVLELRHRPGDTERRLRRFATQLAALAFMNTRCTTRLGFGATPLLASLAASVAPANGAFGALTQSQLQFMFAKAPVAALPSVGDKTASALRAHGIVTCADLLEPARLVAAHTAIGVAHTARLIALLHGVDAFALFAPPAAPVPITPAAPRQRTLTGALVPPPPSAPAKRRLGLARPVAPPSSTKRRTAAAVPITKAGDIDVPTFRELPPAVQHEVLIEHRLTRPQSPVPRNLVVAPLTASQTAQELEQMRRKRQRTAAAPPALEFAGANNNKLARLHEWLRGAECADGEQLLSSFVVEMIAMRKLDHITATVRRRSPRFVAADAIVQRHAVALLRAHIALT